MKDRDVNAIRPLVYGLADRDGRTACARRLAEALGGRELMVFLRDSEVGALVPAPGFPRTTPGGPTWHQLLAECASPGLHRGRVAFPSADETSNAVARTLDDGFVFLLLGGDVRALDSDELMLPLLSALFHAEMAAEFAGSSAKIARSAARHASALTKAVDLARSQAEQARRAAEDAARTKDEFLAMLGHELRNPLSPIVTALELLRARGQGSGREFGIIQRQVQHLGRLVDDLLDIARITRGKVELKREVLEISEPIAKAIEIARPLLDQRRHTLIIDVPAHGLRIDGDRVRVAQVVANLLNNAAKYTEIGGRVELAARSEGGEVVVCLRDNGIGIGPELLPRIFDLFQQGRRGAERSGGGLGIGLSLVRNLVGLHGGRVAARSDGPGRGSEFEIRFPIVEAHAATAEEPPRDSGLRAVTPRRILLVDDNVEAAELLSDMLRAAGHRVETAFDGPSALGRCEELRPEVALIDIGLPVMDGYDLGRRLRESPHPPRLIALTGYGRTEDLARSLAAGFEAHLVKPISIEQVIATIEGGCMSVSGA